MPDAKDQKQKKQKYLVLIGIDYPPDRRAEEGDVVDDIPLPSLTWLIKQGVIEPVRGRGKPKEGM